MDDKAIDKTALYDNLHRIKRKFLVQTRLVQHEEMNRLYPTSVNTLRIVTVYDRTTGEVEVLHTLLRVGAHGNVVDNWAKGGLAIAVDSDGRLAEYGFYKPQFGNKVNKHPDSRIVFKTFVVPYFQEALHMTKAFHEKLSGIHSIGWDVAITPQGPVFIEGNDNWEISLHQAFSGLRMRINHLFPNE